MDQVVVLAVVQVTPVTRWVLIIYRVVPKIPALYQVETAEAVLVLLIQVPMAKIVITPLIGLYLIVVLFHLLYTGIIQHHLVVRLVGEVVV